MRIYRFDLASRRIATMDSPSSAPPSILLTSRPYAVETEDAAQAAVALTLMRMLTPPVDSLDSTGDIVYGLLRQILVQYTQPPESIDAAGVIEYGLLRQILIPVDQPPEAIDSTGDIVYGLLQQIVITTAVPPEGIDAGAPLIVSGILE